MKRFKLSLPFKLLLVCALLAFAPQVYALSITPASGVLNTSRWEGNQTGDAFIQEAIDPIIGSSVLLYKDNVGGAEEGSLAGSYQTIFTNDPLDPKDATITYTGGNFVAPPAFLLVKDGNQEPAWYLFNLTILGWNGTTTLELTDFWPKQGAISYVGLYGTTGTSVPEPATMLLLGTGLFGLVVARRRFKK